MTDVTGDPKFCDRHHEYLCVVCEGVLTDPPGYRFTPTGHRFAVYDVHSSPPTSDDVDPFAGYNTGTHNGPSCVDCGKGACWHCHPEFTEERCPKADTTDVLAALDEEWEALP